MENENRRRRSPELALIAGIGLGVIVALLFRKLAVGILAGILVAYLLYRNSK